MEYRRGRMSPRRKRQVVQTEKRQLVPVPSLELNERISDMEEPTAAKTARISPFENGPFAILEEILHDAHHLGSRELARKHCPDLIPAVDRVLRHLMVDGELRVKSAEPIDVG